MSRIHEIAVLARAWRSYVRPAALRSSSSSQGNCGVCDITLDLTLGTANNSFAQRLGELVRLFLLAARGGSDVFRLLYNSPTPCPCVTCAWCDGVNDADTAAVVAIRVNTRGVVEPKILKAALFDWNESASATCHQYIALRDALQALVDSHSRAAIPVHSMKVTVDLLDLHRLMEPDYLHQLEELLDAASKAYNNPATTLRVDRLTLLRPNTSIRLHELTALLQTVFKHPVPVALKFSVDVSALVGACADERLSQAAVTEMTHRLDPFSLENDSTMIKLCELLTTRFESLERLVVSGCICADTAVERRSLALLGSALLAPTRLKRLSLEDLWYDQCDEAEQMLVSSVVASQHFVTSSLRTLAARTLGMARVAPLSVERLLLFEKPVALTELMRFLPTRPKLHKLSVLVTDEDESRDAGAEAAEPSPHDCWPELTKLTMGFYPNEKTMAQLITLVEKSGASLTKISFLAIAPGDIIELLDAIIRCCPRLWGLSVIDPYVMFVETLAAACDDGRFDLRKLDVRQVASSAPCMRLLQLLSDPHRRLAQTLSELQIEASSRVYPALAQASTFMMQCNTRLVSVDVKKSGDYDYVRDLGWTLAADDEEGSSDCDEENVLWMLDRSQTAVDGKIAIQLAIQRSQLLPDVVMLPSMRRRVAFLSVLAARDVHLPEPVVTNVVMMAGRCALRLS